MSPPGSESSYASRESPRVGELPDKGFAGSGWISPGSNEMAPWVSCVSIGILRSGGVDSRMTITGGAFGAFTTEELGPRATVTGC